MQTTTNEQPATARRPVLAPIPARRGRRRRDELRAYTTSPDGPFRVPAVITERATTMLAPYGNREACLRLFVWLLATNWKRPSGLFKIRREYLKASETLGLTEAQIRRAITRLEEVGLIERARHPAFQRNKDRRIVRHGDNRQPHREAAEFGFAPWIQSAIAGRMRKDRSYRKWPTDTLRGRNLDNRPFSTRTVQGRQSRHADSWHPPLPQGGTATALARAKGAFGVAGAKEGRATPDPGPIETEVERALREFADLARNPVQPLSDAAKRRRR